MKVNIFFAFFSLFLSSSIFSQVLVKGIISDERNSPIPFAKVFVKNAPDLRTISDANGNYEMRLMPGEYYLIYKAGGFQQRESYLSVNEGGLSRNVQLFPSMLDIEKVDVKSKRFNPGREIMLKVVKKREKINLWNYPHSVDVYIKASETVNKKESKKRKKRCFFIFLFFRPLFL